MKISIIGAGAMGSLYGGKLSLSGSQVLLYDINREHIDKIRDHGLIIEEPEGEEITRPEASSDKEALRGSEVMIIFVKSAATEIVVRDIKEYIAPETIVVTLQNGLGNEGIIRKHLGADRSAAGVTSQGATFLEAGRIRHAGRGPTHLCMSDKKNNRLVPFVEELNRAGFDAHIEENIENLIWSKLIINVGINALTALTALPNGKLLDYKETKEIMADLVNEALQVTRAKGIQLTLADPLQRVYEIALQTAANRSSMLQDFDNNRVTEIDFINGAIVREAEKLAIQVPVNRTITRLVKTIEGHRYPSITPHPSVTSHPSITPHF